jgi:predicted ATPase
VGASRGDVGIWHETYRIRAGDYETIYNGMPPIGLGRAGRLVPATGRRDTARARLEDTKSS